MADDGIPMGRFAETADLTDMVRDRAGPLEGQVSTLRSQMRELLRLADRHHNDNEKLRERVAVLEQMAAGIEPKMANGINQALSQPLRRIEERFEDKLDSVGDQLDLRANKSEVRERVGVVDTKVERLNSHLGWLIKSILGALLSGALGATVWFMSGGAG